MKPGLNLIDRIAGALETTAAELIMPGDGLAGKIDSPCSGLPVKGKDK